MAADLGVSGGWNGDYRLVYCHLELVVLGRSSDRRYNFKGKNFRGPVRGDDYGGRFNDNYDGR